MKFLEKLADKLDKMGLTKEADEVDQLMKEAWELADLTKDHELASEEQDTEE